jgi:hypothetical protein
VWSFGPETGFVGGLPPGIQTLPKALKEYAQSIGEDYATSYTGKWGLQGATWANSPMGAGYVSRFIEMWYGFFMHPMSVFVLSFCYCLLYIYYIIYSLTIPTTQDETRSFPEHSTDGCDGMLSFASRVPSANGGGTLARSIPAYWDQGAEVKSDLCDFFQGLDQLTDEEKHIACHSQPRAPPKLIDEDLLDYTKNRECQLFEAAMTMYISLADSPPSVWRLEQEFQIMTSARSPCFICMRCSSCIAQSPIRKDTTKVTLTSSCQITLKMARKR